MIDKKIEIIEDGKVIDSIDISPIIEKLTKNKLPITWWRFKRQNLTLKV